MLWLLTRLVWTNAYYFMGTCKCTLCFLPIAVCSFSGLLLLLFLWNYAALLRSLLYKLVLVCCSAAFALLICIEATLNSAKAARLENLHVRKRKSFYMAHRKLPRGDRVQTQHTSFQDLYFMQTITIVFMLGFLFCWAVVCFVFFPELILSSFSCDF